MTLEDMKRVKKEKGYTYPLLAAEAELPLSTVQKIFTGETAHPRYQTLLALEDAFVRLERGLSRHGRDPGRGAYTYGSGAMAGTGATVQEAAALYGKVNPPGELAAAWKYPEFFTKKQGEYTIEDYYALPDDVRVELIDGVFYDMDSPSWNHQHFVGEAHRQIANYIHEKGGGCIPLISPFDVQLDRDEKTMVQPDVGIVCDRTMFKKKAVYGAPDFLIEVISPSTGRRDYTKKLQKYADAGVREYWIVDPEKEHILTYFFEDGDSVGLYPLFAKVPVKIYGGKLVLSFEAIREWVSEAEDEDDS